MGMLSRATKYELTENVTATLTVSSMSAEIKVEGGYADETPFGWALVIGDRFVKRGLDPQIKATNKEATVTLNGGALDGICDECLKEIL